VKLEALKIKGEIGVCGTILSGRPALLFSSIHEIYLVLREAPYDYKDIIINPP
jgi:hypothetical protein